MYKIDLLDEFKEITKYDIQQYLTDVTSFIDSKQQNIINYYAGQIINYDANSFKELQRLLSESNTVEELFILNKDLFYTHDYTDLYDNVSDFQSYLKTIDNSSKWLRSTITKNSFNQQTEQTFLLRQNQTLENLSTEVGYSDRDNDWAIVALRNDLEEEDYTTEGGNLINVSYQNNLSINITSIVDNPLGEQVYGKDIQKEFNFSNDDISVLDYQSTFKQTVEILLNLTRGDNPEFPNDGIKLSVAIGNSLNATYFPALFRQIFDTFAKDDTIKFVSVTDLKRSSDNRDHIEIEVEIQSRIDDIIKETYVV